MSVMGFLWPTCGYYIREIHCYCCFTDMIDKLPVYKNMNNKVRIISTLDDHLSYSSQGAANGSNIWLQQWTDDKYLQDVNNVNTTEYKEKNYTYLGVYGAFGIGQG